MSRLRLTTARSISGSPDHSRDHSPNHLGDLAPKRLAKRVPQFFVEMHSDGSFRRLLRAGLENGFASIVEYYCGVTLSWVSESSLVQAWWFDRSRWRSISMGRALAVIDFLQRSGDAPVPVPPESVVALKVFSADRRSA